MNMVQYIYICYACNRFAFKGLLSGTPRAEVAGTAIFVDDEHNLCGLVNFGAQPSGQSSSNALPPFLTRSEAVTGGIFDVSNTPMVSGNGAIILHKLSDVIL